MTNLSFAAQAILDVFLKTPGEEPMPGWNYGRDLAAALRVAADQVIPIKGKSELSMVRDSFYAIAAELEGIKYGTYRCNLETQ